MPIGRAFTRELIAPGIAHDVVLDDALEAVISRDDPAFLPGAGGKNLAGKIEISLKKVGAVHVRSIEMHLIQDMLLTATKEKIE